MILITGKLITAETMEITKDSFIILDETNLTYRTVPYCESLDSKLCQTSNDKNKPQGRTAFRPFGITTDEKYIYVASNENICSFDINTFEYQKTISTSGRVNTHQLCYNDGYIYRCDTAVNCITKINVNTLEETYIDVVFKKIIPNLYESKYVRDKDIYHINCFFIHDNKLYINASRYFNVLDTENYKKIYDEILNLSNDNYDNSNLMKAIYKENSAMNTGMYHILCIWGNGMDYIDDIGININELKNIYIDIKIEKELDITDISAFVKKIYQNESNNIDSDFIETKINYLKNATQKVRMYLLYDRNPNLELYRDGSNNYIANTNMVHFKKVIRRKYNPSINQNSTRDHYGLLSHNHVIHITNSGDNVDDLLKLMDVNISKNNFDPPKEILPTQINNYLKCIGNDVENNNATNSELIIFNIETNSFENDNKKINGVFNHDVIIINNKTWSLSTDSGCLLRKTTHSEAAYKLVEPNKHFLRGMVKKNNIFYIFANPRKNTINDVNEEETKCIIITFDITEENFVINELDISFKSIYQAIIYTPN